MGSLGSDACLHSIPISKCNHTIKAYNTTLQRIVLPHSITWSCSNFLFWLCFLCPFECQESPGWQHDPSIFVCFDFPEKWMSLITKAVGQTYIKIPVNIKIFILSNAKTFRQNLFQVWSNCRILRRAQWSFQKCVVWFFRRAQ